MSKIKVNEIEKASGSGITIPTGTTLTVTDGLAASTISSGTLADARLPTVPVTKGGTGLTSLGSANQQLRVNSGASALEFYTPTVATSDFVKIASGSISSGVSSYNVDGHFSSTYKNYELIFDDVYASSTGIDLHMRIIEGGSVISGANYAYGYRYQGVNSSGQNNVGDTGGWTSTSAGVTNNISSHINQSAMLHFRIYDPLATDKYKTITHHNLGNYNNNAGILSQIGGFQYRSLNALSGLQLLPTSGTLQGGNWSLYGIKP